MRKRLENKAFIWWSGRESNPRPPHCEGYRFFPNQSLTLAIPALNGANSTLSEHKGGTAFLRSPSISTTLVYGPAGEIAPAWQASRGYADSRKDLDRHLSPPVAHAPRTGTARRPDRPTSDSTTTHLETP